jgi:hypothetical protein
VHFRVYFHMADFCHERFGLNGKTALITGDSADGLTTGQRIANKKHPLVQAHASTTSLSSGGWPEHTGTCTHKKRWVLTCYTGGTKGIGCAIVEHFCKLNCKVRTDGGVRYAVGEMLAEASSSTVGIFHFHRLSDCVGGVAWQFQCCRAGWVFILRLAMAGSNNRRVVCLTLCFGLFDPLL